MEWLPLVEYTESVHCEQHSVSFYVPKNKLFGKDESLRNGKFEVTLHAEKARYEGMR